MLWPLAWVACATGVGAGDAPPVDAFAGDASADVGATSDVGLSTTDDDAGLESTDSGPKTSDDSGVPRDEDAGTGDAPPGSTSEPDAGAGAPDASDASATSAPCPCGAQSVCVGATCVPARRVFVSSGTFDGALGGSTGADTTCQATASDAGLSGVWMAWISDSTSSPSSRFSRPTVGYVLLDGTTVAADWAALTATGLAHAIDLTETGASLAAASADDSKTWTGTLVNGTLGTPSCSDFTSSTSTATGEVGHCTGTGTANWTSAYTTEDCNVSNHVYCFEQ